MAASILNPEWQTLGAVLKLHRGDYFGEVSKTPALQQATEKLVLCAAGPAVAPNYITLGVSADSVLKAGRGGARNSADRVSHALTVCHVANLIAASAHASAIGLPFTRMITIHWKAAGVRLADMPTATGRFVDLLGKALARHGSRAAWLWVHENGEGKGWHCHLLAYVPPELVALISRLQRGWLRRITGRPYRARVIYSEPIGGRLGLEGTNPALHAVNLAKVLGYVLKGASPSAVQRFGMDQVEPGGLVVGKRCSTSQNIAVKARKAGN